MRIVGVRLQRLGSVKYCDSGEHDLHVGDRVLLDLETGEFEGEVIISPDQVLYAASIEIAGSVVCRRSIV